MTYPTPDATSLADRVVRSVGFTTPVYEHRARGLDHGAYIPLLAMFPAADVPVVQVSMPSVAPQALLGLGRRLARLRAEGYLVMGSGFMTHSFAVMRRPDLAGHTRDFDAWAADAVARRDVDALVDYAAKAPAARVAHPTAEHFVPVLLALGATDDAGPAPRSVIEGDMLGNSIRSFEVD